MKKFAIAFATLALAVASAASSHNVTLFQPTTVNGTELKPGDYKVEVEGNKAVFKQGKKAVEVSVKVEENAEKYGANSARYVEGSRLQELRIGGTHTKLVFENAGGAAAGGSELK